MILGPAQEFSGELITTLSVLVLMVFLAAGWRPGLTRPQQLRWVGLAAGTLLATTLLTPRTVLFLPFFFLLSVSDNGGTGAAVKPRWNFPAFNLFLAAFGLGVLLSWLRDPGATLAGYANILHPLLGSRWISNSLWLASISSLITVFRPWKPSPLLRLANLDSAAGVGLLFWSNALVFAAIFRFALPGMEVYALYLLFTCGPMLALVALLYASSTTGFRAVSWVMLAVICLLGSWGMVAAGARKLGTTNQGDLEQVLALVRKDDILLAHTGSFSTRPQWIPFDRAGRGNIQTYGDSIQLEEWLGDPGIAHDHEVVWLLMNGESPWPWQIPFRSPEGQLVTMGEPESPLVLHQFRPKFFPHPVTVFSDRGKSGTTTKIQGLRYDGVWTRGNLSLEFDFPGIRAEHLDITLKDWRPEEMASPIRDMIVQLNGTTLKTRHTEKSMVRFEVPSGLLLPSGNVLEIEAPTFVPNILDQSNPDIRALGLDLHDIVLR